MAENARKIHKLIDKSLFYAILVSPQTASFYLLIFKAKTGRKWENHALYNLEDAKERMLAFEKMLELIRKRMKIIEMNVMEEEIWLKKKKKANWID